MTLAQLTSFVEIARGLSFRRAAERLHLAQPSVSAHIRALERELGTPLFDRLGRQVRLTPAGMTLLEHAERVLLELAQARATVDALAGAPHGVLALATTPSLIGTLLPPAVRQLQREAPHLTLRLSVAMSDGVVMSIRRGEADLGVAYLTHPVPALDAIRLLDDEFILVIAADESLGAPEPLSAAALATLPLIVLASGTAGRLVVDRELARHGLHPQILLEMDSSDAIKGMAMEGVAPAVVSRLAVARELATGALRAVPFSDLTLRHPVVALTRKGHRGGAVTAGLRALRAVYPASAPDRGSDA